MPPYYDPMLAKLIVRGTSRAESLARMEYALREFHVLGVRTNIPYLLAILRHPAFRAGELSTQFLQQYFAAWKPANEIPDAVLFALAAQAVLAAPARPVTSAATEEDSSSPWHMTGAWRNV